MDFHTSLQVKILCGGTKLGINQKCKVNFGPILKSYWLNSINKKNIGSASNYELRFEPSSTTALSDSTKIKISEVERHMFVIDESGAV